MAVVTMKQLLDSGVHFGHQTRRWNPKMKRYIFTERNGIYIIDLQQTLTYIDRAYEFVKETVAHGGSILFIGTKKQAQEAIANEALRVGMPFVNQRWLGGMLTNFSTVHKRLQRLKELESMEQTGGFQGFTKKEILMMNREKDKLERTLGGIRDMSKVPSAVWIVDTKKEHIAVGDIYQVQIGHEIGISSTIDPLEVYQRLRARNPSPYMYLSALAGHTVIGASPELFVRVQDGTVTMRPIAGTIPHRGDVEDAEAARSLRRDPKELAEHTMLVDLCRNDIGRICQPDTL
ncbi:30S ribosomal protein S2, partial [Saccharothrix sp. MB29]|nr:30S ribosomal protein S2 [Saccharothrix sp. MB29]